MSSILNLNTEVLWQKLGEWSRKAGRAATRPVLMMWYVMRSKDTPKKAKAAIFLSLAYLLLPIDILEAKRLPIIGWIDEVVSFAVLVQELSHYITPEMQAKADEQLDKWFPEYAEYEIIEA